MPFVYVHWVWKAADEALMRQESLCWQDTNAAWHQAEWAVGAAREEGE